METIKAIFNDKFTPVLEEWCNTFKFIGVPNETPRYSQVMIEKDTVKLASTQKNLFYIPELTEKEKTIIVNLWLDAPNDLWNLWKEHRTEYLLKNHKTIKAY